MRKHYVIISEWCVDYEGGCQVVGVFHSEAEALAAFAERVRIDDRLLANEYGYEIYEDSDREFDSGKEGYYCHDHITVKIVEVI